jgi:hypothetical protein
LPTLDEEAANDFELRLLATMSQNNALWPEITEDILLIPVNRMVLGHLVGAQAEYGCTRPEFVALYLVEIKGYTAMIGEFARRLLSETQAFPEPLWEHYSKLAVAQPRLRREAGLERRIRVQAGFGHEVDLADEL